MNHGARNSYPLLLATGKHGGPQALPSEQADEVECSPHASADFTVTIAGGYQWQRHIVEHGPLGEQSMILEHDPEMASIAWDEPATNS